MYNINSNKKTLLICILGKFLNNMKLLTHLFDLDFKMVDAATRKAVSNIPQLKTKAGPRDKEEWVKRLKEEYASLISYVKTNKESDTDWFRLESNKEGTRWFGKCWHIQVINIRYHF